jgi:hypothetical protein
MAKNKTPWAFATRQMEKVTVRHGHFSLFLRIQITLITSEDYKLRGGMSYRPNCSQTFARILCGLSKLKYRLDYPQWEYYT